MFYKHLPFRKETGLSIERWKSGTGTCITSIGKDETFLELRQEISSTQFAIVKLHREDFPDSRIEVVEEIETSNYDIAEKRFSKISGELGYEIQPLKDMKYPF